MKPLLQDGLLRVETKARSEPPGSVVLIAVEKAESMLQFLPCNGGMVFT